jgi:hypothetical protein
MDRAKERAPKAGRLWKDDDRREEQATHLGESRLKPPAPPDRNDPSERRRAVGPLAGITSLLAGFPSEASRDMESRRAMFDELMEFKQEFTSNGSLHIGRHNDMCSTVDAKHADARWGSAGALTGDQP